MGGDISSVVLNGLGISRSSQLFVISRTETFAVIHCTLLPTSFKMFHLFQNTQNEYGQIVNYLLAARRNDVTKLMQAFLEDFDLNSTGLPSNDTKYVAIIYDAFHEKFCRL